MGEAVEGRRRAPEKSVLLEAFRRGWPEVSSSMPSRVKPEVERYLTWGDPRFQPSDSVQQSFNAGTGEADPEASPA